MALPIILHSSNILVKLMLVPKTYCDVFPLLLISGKVCVRLLWSAASRMVPKGPSLWYLCPCANLSLSVWAKFSDSLLRTEYSRRDGMSLRRFGNKKAVVSILGAHSFALRKASCHGVTSPVESPHGKELSVASGQQPRRNQGPQSIACEKLGPVNNHRSEVGSEYPINQTFQWDCRPSQVCPCVETLNQRHLCKPHLMFITHINCEIINAWKNSLVKHLSLGFSYRWPYYRWPLIMDSNFLIVMELFRFSMTS